MANLLKQNEELDHEKVKTSSNSPTLVAQIHAT